MSIYNYSQFPLDEDGEDFERFPRFLSVGGSAPDGALVDSLDGKPVRLSDSWRAGPAVIEFGSIT